jgi:hypothetical protein
MASLGDIAHGDSLLGAIGDKDCGIGIDHGAVKKAQAQKKLSSQSVVSSFESAQMLGVETPQKAPQGIAVREVRQTQKWRDKSIVDQRLSALHPANPRYNRKDVRQEKIGRVVLAVMITRPTDVELEEVSQPQRFAKRLKKAQAAKACEGYFLE